MAERTISNANQATTAPSADTLLSSTNIPVSSQMISKETYRKDLIGFQYSNQNSPTFTVSGTTHGATVMLEQKLTQVINQHFQNPNRIYDINFERKVLAYLLASERASGLFTAMNLTASGMNMEQQKVFSILRNCENHELKLITDLYQNCFKRNLSLDIRYGLKSDLTLIEHANTLLEGERLPSFASEIKILLNQDKSSAAELQQLLNELNIEEIQTVKKIMQEKYSLNLEEQIKSKFIEPEYESIRLELIKDKTAIHINTINELIVKTPANQEQLIQYLRELNPESLALLKSEKINLDKISDPLLKQICQLHLESNKPLAESLYINNEINNKTLDIFKLEKSFNSLDDTQRKTLTELYQNKFESKLETDLALHFQNSPIEKSASKQLLENGSINDTTKIYLLTKELENKKQLTNELINTLNNKSYNEITQIKHEVTSIYQSSLDAMLVNSLNSEEQSRTQLEARIALYGKPETFEDEVNRIRARYEFERIHLPVKFKRIIDLLFNKGKKADHDMKEIEKEHTKLSKKNEHVSEEEELKFYTMLSFFEKSLNDYEKTRELYSTTIENLIGAGAAIMTFIIAKDLSDSLYLTLPLSGLAFLISKFTTRTYIKESVAIEKSLISYKERRRNRKKSYYSRRMTRKRG